jgi:hypothetical protein
MGIPLYREFNVRLYEQYKHIDCTEYSKASNTRSPTLIVAYYFYDSFPFCVSVKFPRNVAWILLSRNQSLSIEGSEKAK